MPVTWTTGRNYMAGPKAPKGPGFAERVTLRRNDIMAPPVRGDAGPLDPDPHNTKLGPDAVQQRWNDIRRGRR